MAYSNGDIIRVINEDCTGRKLMRKTASADDGEAVKEAFTAIIDKYGLDIEVVQSQGKKPKPIERASPEFKW